VPDDTIRELVAEGKTANQITKITGYSQPYPYRRLSDLGLQPKKAPTFPSFRSAEGRRLNARIAHLRSEGHSFEAIGEMVGLRTARAKVRYDWHMWDVGP